MDAATRANERAASTGDHEAEARAIAQHLRAGGRDPRKDPRPGDIVAKGMARLVALRGEVPMRDVGEPPGIGSLWDAVVFAMRRESVDDETFRHERVPCIVRSIREHCAAHGVPVLDLAWVIDTGPETRVGCKSVVAASWRRWARGGTVLRLGEMR